MAVIATVVMIRNEKHTVRGYVDEQGTVEIIEVRNSAKLGVSPRELSRASWKKLEDAIKTAWKMREEH